MPSCIAGMQGRLAGCPSVIRAPRDPSIPCTRAIWLWTLLEGIITLSRVSGSVGVVSRGGEPEARSEDLLRDRDRDLGGDYVLAVFTASHRFVIALRL